MFEVATAASASLLAQHLTAAQTVSTDITLSAAFEVPSASGSAAPAAVILICTVDHLTGRLELASLQNDSPTSHSRPQLHMSAISRQYAAPSKLTRTSSLRTATRVQAHRVLQLATPPPVHIPAFVARIDMGTTAAAPQGCDERTAARVDSSLQLGAVAPHLRGSEPAALAVPVGASAYCRSEVQLTFAVAAPRDSNRITSGMCSECRPVPGYRR